MANINQIVGAISIANKTAMEEIEFTQSIKATALKTKAMYDAYLEVGFNNDEAYSFTVSALENANKN